MIIKWKQQHINNACAPACMAMLLSQYGIDKEDFDIIFESKRPYMIEYQESDNSFCNGVLYQSFEIMDIVPNKHGLAATHNFFDSYQGYLKRAKQLLENNIPFITSLPQRLLPSPGYKRHSGSRGHAVVVYKTDNGKLYFLDPDGGIDRNKDNKFDDVSDSVSYSVSVNELEAMLRQQDKYLIGHIQKQATRSEHSIIPNLLKNSKQALEKYTRTAAKEILNITKEDGSTDYDDFYSFIIRLIKPFVMDLKHALMTIPNASEQEVKLIALLEDFFRETLCIQRKLKNDSALLMESYFNYISIQIEEVQFLMTSVIDKEDDKHAPYKGPAL